MRNELAKIQGTQENLYRALHDRGHIFGQSAETTSQRKAGLLAQLSEIPRFSNMTTASSHYYHLEVHV